MFSGEQCLPERSSDSKMFTGTAFRCVTRECSGPDASLAGYTADVKEYLANDKLQETVDCWAVGQKFLLFRFRFRFISIVARRIKSQKIKTKQFTTNKAKSNKVK